VLVPKRVAPDPSPPPVRCSFTPAYKLVVVAEYETAPHAEKSAVLRRKGLHYSHIKDVGSRLRRRSTLAARRHAQSRWLPSK
jgi:hypothetical protein